MPGFLLEVIAARSPVERVRADKEIIRPTLSRRVRAAAGSALWPCRV